MKNGFEYKLGLAKMLHRLRADKILAAAMDRLLRNKYIRAINYHNVEPGDARNFEEQLSRFGRRFCNVSLQDLGRFFDRGAWDRPKPGLILSFDDGLRSHFAVVAPLLEKYGFTGWFFVPTDFVDCRPEMQHDFARANRISVLAGTDPRRLAMTRGEIAELRTRGHVIASHTRTHHRMLVTDSEETLWREIGGSKSILEEMSGGAVDVYGWVGGEESVYHARAAAHVRRAGYKYAFMTNSAPVLPNSDPLQIQRTNIEAAWPDELVSFQLSGALDVYYLPKRLKVESRTRI